MTIAPRGITARLMVKALLLDGFKQIRTKGSHRIFCRADGRKVVVSYHKLSDTFPIGTLKGMIDDAGWFDEDLKRLNLVK